MSGDRLTDEQITILREAQSIKPDPTENLRSEVLPQMNSQMVEIADFLNAHAEKVNPKGWLAKLLIG